MATISKTGKTWRAQVRRSGARPISRSFPTREQAEEWAMRNDRRHQSLADRGRGDLAGTTLGDLIDQFINLAKNPTARTRGKITVNRNKEQNLRYWQESIGDTLAADVDHDVLNGVLDDLAVCGPKGVPLSGGALNRYLSSISTVLQWAAKRGIIDHNPARLCDRGQESGRFRVLDADERRRLLDACDRAEWDGLGTLVRVALATGIRKGNLQSLRWGQVDLDHGQIYLPDTKNGTPHVVPVMGEALPALRDWADRRALGDRDDNALVFPLVNWEKHWNRSRITSGINDPDYLKRTGKQSFRFHDLRHTCASYLSMAGVDMRGVAAVLNHKTVAMAYKYSHWNTESVGNALSRGLELMEGDG